MTVRVLLKGMAICHHQKSPLHIKITASLKSKHSFESTIPTIYWDEVLPDMASVFSDELGHLSACRPTTKLLLGSSHNHAEFKLFVGYY